MDVLILGISSEYYLPTCSSCAIQVSHARRVYGVNGEVPDSYVKCYLRDGDKWLHKRKTRIVRRTTEPKFKQTLKYQVTI